jgi:ATP-binding cassette subfamily F protein 3
MEQAESPDLAPKVAVEVVRNDDSSAAKESRKDRKRREAQSRIVLYKKQGPIREEIEKIEKELQTKEARKKEIEALMADPANYDNKELILSLCEEDPILAKEIRDLESRWEELHGQLEEIENAVLTG